MRQRNKNLDSIVEFLFSAGAHALSRKAAFRKKVSFLNSTRGITLIEMIAVIVVLGLAIPVLLTTWADVAMRSTRSEAISEATFYAEALLEEIKSKRFDENLVSPWSSSLDSDNSTKGIDGTSNETSSNMSNWDDIDDFNGYSDSPGMGFTRCVTVDYVTLNSGVWTGNCGGEPSGCSAPSCSSGDVTDYKRIRVRIFNSQLGVDIDFSTMVSSF